MKTVLSVEQIRELIPHRWPFLLLDRVVELKPGDMGVGLKNVTVSEPFFEGHFPRESIMPGVLIVEALAQLTAVVYGTKALQSMQENDEIAATTVENDEFVIDRHVDISSRVGYLVAIKEMKFLKTVVPGDQLRLKVKIGKKFGVLSQVKVAAYVARECVAKGALTVSERPDGDKDTR